MAKLGRKTKIPYVYQCDDGTFRARPKIKTLTGFKFPLGVGFNSPKEAVDWIVEQQAYAVVNTKQNVQPNITLGAMSEQALAEKSAHKNIRMIRYYLDQAVDFFGANTPIEDLDRANITNYVHELRGRGLSDPTIRHHLAEIRWMMRLAADEHGITRKFKMPKLDACGMRDLPFNLADFRKVVAHLPWYQKPILRLMMYTMQRKTVIFNIKWSQYRMGQDGKMRLHLVPNKTTQQTKEEKTFLIEGPLKADIEALPKVCEWMMPNPMTRKPYENFYKSFSTACANAGVAKMTFHHVKHLGVTHWLEKTGNVAQVSALSGTSEKLIRERYAHLTGANEAESIGVISDIYALESA